MDCVEKKPITVYVISFYKPQNKQSKRLKLVRKLKLELNDVFWGSNARRWVPLIQFQVKLQKTAEITYWEAKKLQTRYRPTYLEVLN